MKSLGQLAYERYSAITPGVGQDGKPLALWNTLSADIRTQWELAAHEVARRITAKELPHAK